MNLLRKTWGIVIAVIISSCHSATFDTISPDGTLKVGVVTTKDGDYGKAAFVVHYKGDSIFFRSELGLETDAQKFAGNLRLKSVSEPKSVIDDYRMITGKRSHCVNEASERVYSLENDEGQTLEVTFRVYNDGIAFKYGLKAISDEEHIINEYTAYALPQGSKRWIQQYDPGYEKFFPLSTDGKLANRPEVDLWGYPALIEPRDSVFVLITEANIRRGHCGSFLYNGDNRDNYQVRLGDKKLAFSGVWESPWRLLIAGSLADITESTLVTDVSDPSKVEDTEWIKPGMVSWIYWAYNHGSQDYQIVKEYIDLAVKMKWPYDLIDWEWDVMRNGGNIQDAVKYALSQGVKPLVWYNSSTNWIGPGPLFRLNKKADREKEYKWLSDMGVAGIKVDFFSGDSVSTMNYYIDLLEDAVKYKLMLNFHGATIPRGWQRTYPHMMSVEGVYGAEWYNNTPVLTNRAAEHNATLPFTRNVVGPMDYTPGIFDTQLSFLSGEHSFVHTTLAKQLALYVTLYSPLQMAADLPESYERHMDAFQFIKDVAVDWDDSKYIEAEPGEYITVARKAKGTDNWFVGGITGENPRTSTFILDFLDPGKQYVATLYADGKDADYEKNPTSYEIKKGIVTNKTKISTKLARSGGFALSLIEATPADRKELKKWK